MDAAADRVGIGHMREPKPEWNRFPLRKEREACVTESNRPMPRPGRCDWLVSALQSNHGDFAAIDTGFFIQFVGGYLSSNSSHENSGG